MLLQFQMQAMVWSPLLERQLFSIRQNTNDPTHELWPSSCLIIAPVATSHSRMADSENPVRTPEFFHRVKTPTQ